MFDFALVERDVRRGLALALTALALGAGIRTSAAAPPPPRVGLLLESGGPRDPFGAITLAGFRRGVRDFGVIGKAVTQGPKESAFPALASMARQRYDLVIGHGILQAEAFAEAARAFPRTRFAIVDTPWEEVPGRPANVLGVRYRVEEAAYLAGYLAVLMEDRRPGRHVVSAVGGYSVPTVDPFIAGYRAGARAADPHVVVLVGYARDFVDPEKCRRVALDQIAKGSGVVFPVAGGCGLGALQAARAHGVWGVGVDADQSRLGPHILTSVVKRMDLAVYEMIGTLVHGTFRPGRSLIFDLRGRGVGLGRISPRVPRALRARVDRLCRRIEAGEVGPIPTALTALPRPVSRP